MAEVTSRTLRAFATMLLMPVFDWILTPRMRPFRWSRIIFNLSAPHDSIGGFVGWHRLLLSHPNPGRAVSADR